MLSAGILLCLASAMIVRRRGFMSGSPPPARAATVNSLMRRVKILPRLASAAPFLCLMECHLEWPDMSKLQKNQGIQGGKCYHRAGLKACTSQFTRRHQFTRHHEPRVNNRVVG